MNSFRTCALAGFAGALATWVPTGAGAQEIVEIDYSVGRDIINDVSRSMSNVIVEIDTRERTLYVRDAELPDGVMVFSLDSGELLRTIEVRAGGGPFELPQGISDIALADGVLYAADPTRVVAFDRLGEAVGFWQPRSPMRKHLCGWSGSPAVPTHRGMVRQGADGKDETIGPDALAGAAFDVETMAEARTISDRIWNARAACSDDAAYVVMPVDRESDSVFTYTVDGEQGRVALPPESADAINCTIEIGNRVIKAPDCPTWRTRLVPSLDAEGDLVLLSNGGIVAGVVIDPETRCYALLRQQLTRDNPATGRIVRIVSDSALVFHEPFEIEMRPDDTSLVRSRSGANRASLHPLRRVSGEACPGMLPSAG